MAFEGSKGPKGISIPDTDEGIFGAADYVFIVDAKIEDTSAVSGENVENLSRDHETRGRRVIDVPVFVEFQAEDAASMTPE